MEQMPELGHRGGASRVQGAKTRSEPWDSVNRRGVALRKSWGTFSEVLTVLQTCRAHVTTGSSLVC